MAGRIILPLPSPCLNATGDPISGAYLYFYQNSTTTPQAIYTGPNLGTAITNPVRTNSAGRWVDDSANVTEFWAANDKSFTVVWKDSSGSTLATFNNIVPSALTNSSGAASEFADTSLSNVTAGSVGATLLASNAVTTVKITDLAITGAKVAAATISGDKMVAGVIPIGENILPNTQFEVMTDGANSARYKADSSGVEGAVTVTSYTTGANEITCVTSDTTLLQGTTLNPDFVDFSAAADANLKISTSRVYGVVVNTSFRVRAPRNLTATSAACTVTPQMRGDMAGTTGNANDGWTKTAAAYFFINTHRANIKTGHKRSGALLKTSGSAQYYIRSIPTKETLLYAGRNIVFGMWVKQAVKGGSGTGRLGINQITGGVPSTTYSSSISSGATTSDWTYMTVTALIADAPDTIDLFFEANGSSGDLYYMCGAHAQLGTYLPEGAYMQRKDERIIPVVKMAPLTHINASVTFPAVADTAGMYSYNFDLCAETDMAFQPTIDLVYAQAEGRHATVNRAFAFKDQEATPHKYGIHPFYSQVSNQIITSGGELVFAADGTCRPYSPTSAAAFTQVSFDIETPWLNVSR